jgi:hypothetical protein
MSQLNLAAQPGQRAEVRFGVDKQVYSMGADSSGFFVEHQDRPMLHINKQGEVHVKADVFAAQELAAGSLELAGVPQRSMVALELFNNGKPTSAGWNTDQTISCAGLTILTGPRGSARNPAEPAMKKTYSDLPPHNQITFAGVAHFVDDFQDETVYMQVNEHYVWTASHDQRNSRGTFNVCGKTQYPESRFSVPFEVTLPHSDPTVTVAFGSTLEPGAEADFGISSMTVYLRTAPIDVNAAANPPATPQPVAASKPKSL